MRSFNGNLRSKTRLLCVTLYVARSTSHILHLLAFNHADQTGPMSGRANCNPHRFQPSMGETRTTRALSLRIVCRSFTFLRMGAEGISSDTRDRRRKGLRIASSAPPALSLSKVQNSRNSLPCPLMPRTKTGMARESRAQRRRSGVG